MQKEMKCTHVPAKDTSNVSMSHRKENNPCDVYKLIAMYKGEFQEVADIRIYYPKGNGSRVYCCAWIRQNTWSDTYKYTRFSPTPEKVKTNKKSHWWNGSGYVDGWGYHKPSSAIEEALESAGFKFNKSFGGCGDSTAEEAIKAIGRKLGYKKTHLVKAYG